MVRAGELTGTGYSDESAELERAEHREFKRANEILRFAVAFFARTPQ